MFVKLRSAREQLRSSLFYVPMLFIIGAVGLGEAALGLDATIASIPDRLTATVDSARQVLTVVAGATLSFAGIAFSVSLLLISQASSQYSPRVAHGLFRDPFNKRVMGLVVGTFTYCLIVLRSVRGPLEQSGEAVVPSISILVAVALGLVSILAIVAFISHSAHSMDVSNILRRATDEALDSLTDMRARQEEDGDVPAGELPTPAGDGFRVTFDEDGWIQQIDHAALLRAVAPGTTVRLDTAPGRYALAGTPMCTTWPRPRDEEEVCRATRAAVAIGVTRTMQQDVTFGVRQLADVALKALSPGINDPTTAQDALYHLATVVREVILRGPSERLVTGEEDRRLLLPEHGGSADVIDLAFDEVRIAAATAPTVQVYLLDILRLLVDSLDSQHEDAVAALRRQADLTLEISQLADLPETDLERVRSAHHHRFVE